MELDKATRWNDRALDFGNSFSSSCRTLCEENPNKYPNPLASIMVDTMTELWDVGFSQSEIRDAFTEAIAELPKYAAGEESRR